MVTMMKEKVNTHFSFPMKLNMAAYTEQYLIKRKEHGGKVDLRLCWVKVILRTSFVFNRPSSLPSSSVLLVWDHRDRGWSTKTYGEYKKQ